MKTAEEEKELIIEIAELLKQATYEQKLIIKGMLMGAKESKGVRDNQKAG